MPGINAAAKISLARNYEAQSGKPFSGRNYFFFQRFFFREDHLSSFR
jgi:hypothetical protein